MSSRFLDTQFLSHANSTNRSSLQLSALGNPGRVKPVSDCYLFQRKIRLLRLSTDSLPLTKLQGQQWPETILRPRALIVAEASVLDGFLKAAPISLPDGPWVQIPGGITAPIGFQATGIYAGLRAAGEKPDLALLTCEVDAISAGTFTKNVMAAAPVIYCKQIIADNPTARAVLINAGQANAATGDAGYQDALDCAKAVAKLFDVKPEDVLLLSTGVIGHQIKKDALFKALPKLKSSLSRSISSSYAAAVAITTTDLVTKSIAIETQIGGRVVKLGGMAKGSGMIHPNMATMLSVVTCDAPIEGHVWRAMLQLAVTRSFNQITVDGDTSTNDTVIALSSGLCGGSLINDIASTDAQQLQKALDVVLQGLAKSVAWDGEGATCLIEVIVTGAETETAAATVARSVAASSLTKAAIFGGDPNWGRIACAAGYAGVDFDPNNLHIKLGNILLMKDGQPLPFDRDVAQKYLRSAAKSHGTVQVTISIGNGPGKCQAWGCDLTYDYIRINAEYTS